MQKRVAPFASPRVPLRAPSRAEAAARFRPRYGSAPTAGNKRNPQEPTGLDREAAWRVVLHWRRSGRRCTVWARWRRSLKGSPKSASTVARVQRDASSIRLPCTAALTCSLWKSSAPHDHRGKPQSCQMMLSALLNRCARSALPGPAKTAALRGANRARAACTACIGELPVLAESCPGAPSQSRRGGVRELPQPSPHFDATLALWRYEFPCDRLVQALKYRAQLALAGFFARSLASRPLPSSTCSCRCPCTPGARRARFNSGLSRSPAVSRGI